MLESTGCCFHAVWKRTTFLLVVLGLIFRGNCGYESFENPIEDVINGPPGAVDQLDSNPQLNFYRTIDAKYQTQKINDEIKEIHNAFGIASPVSNDEDEFEEESVPIPIRPQSKKRAEISNDELAFGHSAERRSMMAGTWAGQRDSNELLGARESKVFKWQYIVLASGCTLAGVIGVMLAAGCWYNINQRDKNKNLEAGLRGSETARQGDAKLAQSAQMYHYQHQKQQMIASDRHSGVLHDEPASEEESDQDDAAEDFTVYECPGMAMGGEMEVKNPMFQPDPPSPTGSNEGAEKKN